jgi:hypothetical protein
LKYRTESGQVLILVALGLVAVMAMVVLAVDGGQLFAERRSAQNAADNAAMAAAYAICEDEDPNTAALDSAAINGYDNNGATNTVILNNPPDDGPYVGDDEYSEAIVDSHRSTYFAQLIGINELPVTTRAVSRCREHFDYAVIALNDSNEVRGIEIVGDGNLTVNDGCILSNSTHPTEAIYENSGGGGSGFIAADCIDAVGGVTCANCSPAPNTGVPPISDPLAFITPPSNPGGACIDADYSGAGVRYLEPGLYCQIRGDASVSFFLNPGIYYIDGPGGFEITGNSDITGFGVMIYFSPAAGAVDMSGNAFVNLEACQSTGAYVHQPDLAPVLPWCVGSLAQYSGMLFYADRSYTQNIAMIGNSTWNAIGTIYAAGSFLDLSGNGDVNNLSSMVVADTIRLGGDSDVVVNYVAGLNVLPPKTVSLIE